MDRITGVLGPDGYIGRETLFSDDFVDNYYLKHKKDFEQLIELSKRLNSGSEEFLCLSDDFKIKLDRILQRELWLKLPNLQVE